MDCHGCRFYLAKDTSCLLEENRFWSIEKVKKGLIGNCSDYKPFLYYEDEAKKGH